MVTTQPFTTGKTPHDVECKEAINRSDFIQMLENRLFTPYFQPIFDLFTGDIFGYEILTRGTGPIKDPSVMFACAEKWDLLWQLEHACRMESIKKITELPETFKKYNYFLNVSPYIFNDPSFSKGFTRTELNEMGIDFKNIVIEITESTSVKDYRAFENVIRHYVEQGFRVALDDFGAGHSGMITLIAMTPHFLKVDRAIITDIHLNSYKQKLIKAISAFSNEVESSMIAEGIEKYEELQTVFRQGVRYGQGFLLGKPLPYPAENTAETKKLLHNLIEDYNHTRFAVDISITRLVSRPSTVERGTMNCSDLDREFKRNNAVDHLVVVDRGTPVKLITSQDFYSAMGGRYGYALYENRSLESIPTSDMLIVEEHIDLRTLNKYAMSRNHRELYNPVVITDKLGHFIGTITIKQLLSKAFDMEIKIASYSNPLTGLPGNMIIGVWLEEVLARDKFTVIYGDLNHFKEYNDNYGFAKGDDMLKFTAKILQQYLNPIEYGINLGHIGGDDFIAISQRSIPEYVLENICRDFDDGKVDFFSSDHLNKGFYLAVNRQGREEHTPIVSLSLAVVTEQNFSTSPHPGRLSEIAALLKKKIKYNNIKSPKSDYLQERRTYD